MLQKCLLHSANFFSNYINTFSPKISAKFFDISRSAVWAK